MKSHRYKIALTIFLALMMFAKKSRSQSCSGEIVHFRETFGTGGGTAALAAGRTNYNYNGSASLADGDYRLNKNSNARAEWHNAVDHTGDGNGRMMITNASYAPGEFYRDTVFVLSSNTFYAVYLYVMNLNLPTTCGASAILPDLSFIVESYNPTTQVFTQVATFTSGSIQRTASPVWVLTGGFFTLPPAVTAVRYRIINNSTGGCGNDLAIDDITFAQCPALTLATRGFQFGAKQTGGKVELTWSTQSEQNTDKFKVEKSADGKRWETIATREAAGNSITTRTYKVEDAQPFPETHYRVLQTDLDGKFTYSSIVVVKTSIVQSSASAYPNPFNSALTIQYYTGTDETVVLRIMDINGKLVRTMNWHVKKGPNSTSLANLKELTTGIYHASIIGANGNVVERLKLVKL
ncbi:MAG: T9SS type A sorting domain-containing protein [Chitinophagaceae bacterium]|nr:T9SS type A sorting domain-containing protein [Chitinophagaceae bacterium]